MLWTFYTIPGPGEPGHETWPQHNDSWKYGGGSVWQTPAIDPELGLVYFSTGNAGPDYNGAVRAGDNLYTVSIVAIELKTGKYRWHFQQVHHDIWDYDSPNPVVLMDLRMDGRVRKAIVEVGKTGWAYILDRETGEPIVGIDERPVPQEPLQATAATQPYPRGDAIVPQQVRDRAGRVRARQQRKNLHAVRGRKPDDRQTGPMGRSELAAERLRPREAVPVRLRNVRGGAVSRRS